MDEHTLRVLEFQKVLGLLADEAAFAAPIAAAHMRRQLRLRMVKLVRVIDELAAALPLDGNADRQQRKIVHMQGIELPLKDVPEYEMLETRKPGQQAQRPGGDFPGVHP